MVLHMETEHVSSLSQGIFAVFLATGPRWRRGGCAALGPLGSGQRWGWWSLTVRGQGSNDSKGRNGS